MRRSPSKKLSMSTDKVYSLDPFSTGKDFDNKKRNIGQLKSKYHPTTSFAIETPLEQH